jgi:hypothetical protein
MIFAGTDPEAASSMPLPLFAKIFETDSENFKIGKNL